MKIVKSVSVTVALTLISVATQAQATPEAIIGQCPSLPTPQQWAAGNTETFLEKINELQGKLSAQTANSVPNLTQKDLEEAAAHQQRQQEKVNRQMKQNFGFDANDAANMTEAELEAKMKGSLQQAQAQAMSELQKQMAVLASLGITEIDLKKLEKMNDKQAEAYIKKRLTENGFTEAELRKRMAALGGNAVVSEAEWKEEQRRERQTQAEAEAIIKAQETLDAYMEQSQIVGKLIGEAEQTAVEKLNALAKKYEPLIAKAQGEANQWEEVMRGTMKKEEVESRQKKANAIVLEYRTQAYQIWSEYILNAQGRLKMLLQYAVAADTAKAKMPSMTGNAVADQLQRMSNYAVAVAAQYLNLTASEPNVIK